MMHTLFITQNSDCAKQLLKASAVAYRNAKSKEFVFTYSLCFLAIAYPVTYIFLKDEGIKHFLFAISLLITVGTWFLTDYFKGNTTKGALLKEEFDTQLYNLPWRFMLKKVDPVEVIELADQYRGSEINNWYPSNISSSVPHTAAIAVCQRISSSWDIGLRAKFNGILYAVLIVYTLAVFFLYVIKSVDGKTIFLLYFSTLSFYTHVINLIRGNKAAIKKRKEVIAKLDDYINHKKTFGTEDLRDVQDELYTIRQEPSKIPDWFCSIHYKKINAIQEKYVEERVNSLY